MGKTLRHILSSVTESCDIVDAFWDAMPLARKKLYIGKLARNGSFSNWERFKEHQASLPSSMREQDVKGKLGQTHRTVPCQGRLLIIFKELEHFDAEAWNKALDNIIVNHAKDAIQGRLNRKVVKEWTRNNPRSLFGPSTGPAL